jgi:hypothetical protein
MEFSHDDYMNKTFNELVNMIKDQDELITKLNNKLEKKRATIIDLKKRIVDKPLVEALFEEDTQSDDQLPFTDEQITNTITFFHENYNWLPEQFLDPNKRCLTPITDIMDNLRDWGRCLGIKVQGDDSQILTRKQFIQYLRDEHKNKYNHIVKWNVSINECDSHKYPNGSRNKPYFHCIKK